MKKNHVVESGHAKQGNMMRRCEFPMCSRGQHNGVSKGLIVFKVKI